MKSPMTRRELLRMAGVGSAGLLLAACQPKIVEVEKIVQQTVVVTEEKIVKEAVEVAKEVTRVVETEKIVQAEVAQLPPMDLRFGYPGWAQRYAEIIVAQFQAREPNVNVQLEPIAGDLVQMLYTMAAGGTTPEAQWIADAFVVPLGSEGVMLDMMPMAEADPEDITPDMYPVMLDLGKYENRWYFIAWAFDAPVMYYNRSLFQKAGLPDPDPLGMPWDEWQMACAAMTNEDEQVYGWHGNEAWWAIYVPWMEGFGGRFYNEDASKVEINSPEAAAGCQALADMYVKYNAAVPRGANLGGDPFILGKAATAITNRNKCANIRAANVDFEWDVCLAPIQAKKHVCGSGTMGPGVAATAAKEKKEWAAWQLVKTIASPATQKYFARQYMMIPVLKSLAKDPSWYELPPPPANRDVFLEIESRAITPPNPRNNDCGTVYIGETSKVMNEAWEKMVIAGVPAQEALDEAAGIINDCIVRGGA
jgi:multiple sugar transport system substrate-binding protein